MKKPVLLLVIVFVTSPVQAACHHYKIWRFPFPQRCLTALAPLFHVKQIGTKPASRVSETFQERIELLLPNLAFEPCPEGDEHLMGIAKLRALMDAR